MLPEKRCNSRIGVNKARALTRRAGLLERLDPWQHPSTRPPPLALTALVVTQSNGIAKAALITVVFKLQTSAIAHTSLLAFVKGLGRCFALSIYDVLRHVGPVFRLVLQIRFNQSEQLFEHERPLWMTPRFFPLCQSCKVISAEMMHRQDRLAPLLVVEAHGNWLLAVEHGPVSSE